MTVGQFESRGTEQRHDFRCPVEHQRHEAILKVGNTEYAVTILDESAGGFAVRAEECVELNTDDAGELFTADSAFEVRVAHLSEEPRPPSDPVPFGQEETEGTSGEPPPTWRIGLQRLKELGVWEGTTPRRRRLFRSLRFRSSDYFSSNGSFLLVGIGLAAVCVVVPMLVLRVLSRGADPLEKPLGATGNALEQFAPENPPARTPDWISSMDEGKESKRSWRTSSRGAVSRETAELPRATDSANLGKTIRQLSGATPFTLPQVTHELSLTESQQEAIEQIIDSSGRTIREVDTFAPGSTRLERMEKRDQILAEARQDALTVLTPEQRIRWNELQEAEQAATDSK